MPSQDENHDPAIDTLVNALVNAAGQFRRYEAGHLYKGTDEGREKARTNAHWAEMCERIANSRGRVAWVLAPGGDGIAQSVVTEGRAVQPPPESPATPTVESLVRDFVSMMIHEMPGAEVITVSITGGCYDLRVSWPTNEFGSIEGNQS